jgi:hypothetical protein
LRISIGCVTLPSLSYSHLLAANPTECTDNIACNALQAGPSRTASIPSTSVSHIDAYSDELGDESAPYHSTTSSTYALTSNPEHLGVFPGTRSTPFRMRYQAHHISGHDQEAFGSSVPIPHEQQFELDHRLADEK